jgi:hypothetical protein
MNLLISKNSVFTTLSFSVILMCFFYMIDPLDKSWGAEEVIFLKFLPILVLSFLLLIFCGRLFKIGMSINILIFLVLFTYIVTGGLITFIEGDLIEDTFLSRAIIMLGFLGGLLSSQSDKYMHFLSRALPSLIYCFSMFVSILSIVWGLGINFLDRPHIYHEEAAIILVGLFSIPMVLSNNLLKILSSLLMLLGLLLMHKNTSYIMAILYFLVMTFLIKDKFLDVKLRALGKITVFIGFASILSIVLIVLLFFADLLPSGSPGVRLVSYENRLEMFSDSKIFGSYFIGTPILEMQTITGPIRIPSHSDILDVLAFGGVLALFLFLAIPVRILIFSLGLNYNEVFSNKLLKVYFLFLVLFFGLLLTMMVNPITHQVKLGVLYWYAAGYLSGMIKHFCMNSNI